MTIFCEATHLDYVSGLATRGCIFVMTRTLYHITRCRQEVSAYEVRTQDARGIYDDNRALVL